MISGSSHSQAARLELTDDFGMCMLIIAHSGRGAVPCNLEDASKQELLSCEGPEVWQKFMQAPCTC